MYLLGIDGKVSHLEDEVGPDDMEDEEDGEEAVEDVVRREHLHQLGSLHCRTEVAITLFIIRTKNSNGDRLNKVAKMDARCLVKFCKNLF